MTGDEIDRTAEDRLGYACDDRTRFRLRLELFPEDTSGLDPARVTVIDALMSLRDAQIAYIGAREASELGASRFMPGEVFDEAGQHVARISYNGRLWAPEPLEAGKPPVAEAPASPRGPESDPDPDGPGLP